MVFPFGNPQTLTHKRGLPYGGYITRWLATNGKVEERVLSEGSHSSASYGSIVLRSAVSSICYPASPFIATERNFNYLDNTVPRGQLCLPLHYCLQ
jgi:hypothetical protein